MSALSLFETIIEPLHVLRKESAAAGRRQ